MGEERYRKPASRFEELVVWFGVPREVRGDVAIGARLLDACISGPERGLDSAA